MDDWENKNEHPGFFNQHLIDVNKYIYISICLNTLVMFVVPLNVQQGEAVVFLLDLGGGAGVWGVDSYDALPHFKYRCGHCVCAHVRVSG